MRSAYVIGESGTIARPLGESLLMKLSNEEDELVKIYMVNALSEIGHDTPGTLQTLTTLYDSLDATNVPPSFGGSYAEVDQKINLAAAIFVLSKPEAIALQRCEIWIESSRQRLRLDTPRYQANKQSSEAVRQRTACLKISEKRLRST